MYLDPYNKLWNLIAEFDTKTTNWDRTLIFSLNEEVINKELKAMLKTGVALQNMFKSDMKSP